MLPCRKCLWKHVWLWPVQLYQKNCVIFSTCFLLLDVRISYYLYRFTLTFYASLYKRPKCSLLWCFLINPPCWHVDGCTVHVSSDYCTCTSATSTLRQRTWGNCFNRKTTSKRINKNKIIIMGRSATCSSINNNIVHLTGLRCSPYLYLYT
jgi:hypothetical protein